MHAIGNVRGVLVRANKAYTLTKDHTPQNEKEKNRVIKAGQLQYIHCSSDSNVIKIRLKICLYKKNISFCVVVIS